MIRIVAALVAAFLLAACTSDEPPGKGAATGPSPVVVTPGPTLPVHTTPAALTRQQAADLYLEIITPANEANDALVVAGKRIESDHYTDDEPAMLEQIREAALAVEAVDATARVQLVELQSTAIEGIDPDDWHKAMADLLRQFSGYDLATHALTEVTTIDDYFAALELQPGGPDSSAADVVRAYLGLPTRS